VSARGRLLSARSIQLAHATLRHALNDAVRDELIPRNPALLVQPGKVPRSTIAPLTLAEAKALLATAASDRLYALWLVLMSLGLRRGEALALRCAGQTSTSRPGRCTSPGRCSVVVQTSHRRAVVSDMSS
jgi:integrase